MTSASSLDKRVEFPRYKAILRSVTGDIADIAIVDSQKVIDIDVLADLRGEVIKFTEAKIYLRKALGSITLELRRLSRMRILIKLGLIAMGVLACSDSVSLGELKGSSDIIREKMTKTNFRSLTST